jgi:hypothetical protein
LHKPRAAIPPKALRLFKEEKPGMKKPNEKKLSANEETLRNRKAALILRSIDEKYLSEVTGAGCAGCGRATSMDDLT